MILTAVDKKKIQAARTNILTTKKIRQYSHLMKGMNMFTTKEKIKAPLGLTIAKKRLSAMRDNSLNLTQMIGRYWQRWVPLFYLFFSLASSIVKTKNRLNWTRLRIQQRFTMATTLLCLRTKKRWLRVIICTLRHQLLFRIHVKINCSVLLLMTSHTSKEILNPINGNNPSPPKAKLQNTSTLQFGQPPISTLQISKRKVTTTLSVPTNLKPTLLKEYFREFSLLTWQNLQKL